MNALLCFKLPEEQLEFDIASKGLDLRNALEKFSTWLEAMKISEKKLDKKSLQIIEAEFKGILDDFGIYLKYQ